jgi:ribose/xylose/arabinose/galactoside ABC-type transport system permease subunit
MQQLLRLWQTILSCSSAPHPVVLLALLLLLCILLPQSAEYRFLSSLNVLNVVQSAIMFVGISAGVLACTAGVSRVSLYCCCYCCYCCYCCCCCLCLLGLR